MPEPYIILLDIDGTLVGDVSYHVAEWEILNKFEPKKLPQMRRQLIESLKNGLLRPFVSDFLTQMKVANEHTEFFLYTASDTKWASFFVPCIEIACGHKFNRPIFSRKHCKVDCDRLIKKSLAKIAPQIMSKLKHRYNFKTSTQVSQHMILVDNNDVLTDKEQRRWIACPTYSYTPIYDVLRNVDGKVMSEHSHAIAQILIRYELMPPVPSTLSHKSYASILITSQYYEAFAKTLRNQAKTIASTRHQKDRYWLSLANAIIALQSKKVPKDTLVKYISNKL